jgi:DMSO/TMAO reductase YedYZ molybdopterin-dependent catalytic subunit
MEKFFRYPRLWLILTLLLAACAAPTPATPTLAAPTATNTPIPTAVPGKLIPCSLPPVTAPTPAPTPNYAELDPSTGLHYTGIAQSLDLATYRLEIGGLVDYPLALSLDELRCLPKIEVKTTIICPGNFEDTAVWAGASLKYLLEMAGIQPEAKDVRLIGADGYSASIARADALSGKAFLAYEWEKQPVPIIHGFPVRAAFPGLLGANWVKWLVKIVVE